MPLIIVLWLVSAARFVFWFLICPQDKKNKLCVLNKFNRCVNPFLYSSEFSRGAKREWARRYKCEPPQVSKIKEDSRGWRWRFSLELPCLWSVVPVVFYWGNTKVHHIHHLWQPLSETSPLGGKGKPYPKLVHPCQWLCVLYFNSGECWLLG